MEALGQMVPAAKEYQAALGFYTPLNPFSRAAADRMNALASRLAASRPSEAKEIEDRLSRSLRATRWLYQPYADLLKARNLSIRLPSDPSPLASLAALLCAGTGIGCWWIGRFSIRRRLVISLGSWSAWALLLLSA